MMTSIGRAIALLVIILAVSLSGCGKDQDVPVLLLEGPDTAAAANPLVGTLEEVSPPQSIQQLKPYLDVYEPQVRIVSPADGEVLNDTKVSVQLRVRDLPIYKDADLGLGPHLHLFLDGQPYFVVYDVASPIALPELSPGTHTLRVLALRPWDESFKNAGAYDQVTFDVFTDSPQNDPKNGAPLLTYNSPQGSYGAEPILLDFHLADVPLHIVAENDDSIPDWRIRCTINGESFVFDRWQPIYLQGFQPGKNWVKLELIDEHNQPIENAFNPSIRVIEYTPNGIDSLSKLVQDEIPLSQAKVLVDPTYEPSAPPTELDTPAETSEADTSTTPGSLPEAAAEIPPDKLDSAAAPNEAKSPEEDIDAVSESPSSSVEEAVSTDSSGNEETALDSSSEVTAIPPDQFPGEDVEPEGSGEAPVPESPEEPDAIAAEDSAEGLQESTSATNPDLEDLNDTPSIPSELPTPSEAAVDSPPEPEASAPTDADTPTSASPEEAPGPSKDSEEATQTSLTDANQPVTEAPEPTAAPLEDAAVSPDTDLPTPTAADSKNAQQDTNAEPESEATPALPADSADGVPEEKASLSLEI